MHGALRVEVVDHLAGGTLCIYECMSVRLAFNYHLLEHINDASTGSESKVIMCISARRKKCWSGGAVEAETGGTKEHRLAVGCLFGDRTRGWRGIFLHVTAARDPSYPQ